MHASDDTPLSMFLIDISSGEASRIVALAGLVVLVAATGLAIFLPPRNG